MAAYANNDTPLPNIILFLLGMLHNNGIHVEHERNPQTDWSMGEDNIQEQLEECHCNREVYMHIVHKLNDCGYEKSFEQCKEYTKKLKKEEKTD